jgi:hypothetical protein
MYIKEITIDGFKSYAQRVVVPDFDRYFNAITVRMREGGEKAVFARRMRARLRFFFLTSPASRHAPPSFLPHNRASTGRASPTSWTPSSLCWASRTCPRCVWGNGSISLAAVASPVVVPSPTPLTPSHPSLNNKHTRHQQVRANSLQELVYKQGQAGVTKATVSIVFDNTDKANRWGREEGGLRQRREG